MLGRPRNTRSDVNHFDLDHVFLVRYPDGSFDAFYDKSARQQELNGSCRSCSTRMP